MRGDNVGSFEAAHGLRDGSFWQTAGTATPTDATYDLIVVGSGISGLARPISSASRLAPMRAF